MSIFYGLELSMKFGPGPSSSRLSTLFLYDKTGILIIFKYLARFLKVSSFIILQYKTM